MADQETEKIITIAIDKIDTYYPGGDGILKQNFESEKPTLKLMVTQVLRGAPNGRETQIEAISGVLDSYDPQEYSGVNRANLREEVKHLLRVLVLAIISSD